MGAQYRRDAGGRGRGLSSFSFSPSSPPPPAHSRCALTVSGVRDLCVGKKKRKEEAADSLGQVSLSSI